MTQEEYRRKAEQNENWAPGWEAIACCIEEVYPEQESVHYGTELTARAIMGGDQFLDGYSIYTSANGYQHIVTFGMTELYANTEMLGSEYSKWGYEMTMKIRAEDAEACRWVLDMMAGLARHTFRSGKWFEPYQYIAGNGESIRIDHPSDITGLLIVEDTELKGRATLHGRIDFMQLVGITRQELEALRVDPLKVGLLIERMKADNNPFLATDMERTVSYI